MQYFILFVFSLRSFRNWQFESVAVFGHLTICVFVCSRMDLKYRDIYPFFFFFISVNGILQLHVFVNLKQTLHGMTTYNKLHSPVL